MPNAVLKSATPTVKAGTSITLSAEESTGNNLTYEWDFNRDGTADYTASTIKHSFDTAGDHFVLLKVTDEKGRVSFDQATIIVE